MIVLGKKFKSPSYAALLGIQDAGSDRKTVNGWTSWKNRNGKLLADLRSEYLKQKENEASPFSGRLIAAAELKVIFNSNFYLTCMHD
ncbi:MAG: hypothetical protein JRJ77_06245 [Deltaproteobacteria bacterium]|nr:hypothetical protein [Deltaproteobacteria bacterium]